MPDMSSQRQKTVSAIRRDIALILVLKLVIILLAAFTIFGGDNRLHVDPETMTTKLMG